MFCMEYFKQLEYTARSHRCVSKELCLKHFCAKEYTMVTVLDPAVIALKELSVCISTV